MKLATDLRTFVSADGVMVEVYDQGRVLESYLLANVVNPSPKPTPKAPTLEDLAVVVKAAEFEFPSLKPVCMAQWILESGRGTSTLFRAHNNAGGMKWRKEMEGYATPVDYQAHDGMDTYCKFASLEAWVRGYWRFIERSPYAGWREAAKGGAKSYISFLKVSGYAEDPDYVNKVMALIPEAEKYLGMTGTPVNKPKSPGIDIAKSSPNFNERTSPITHIVLHNTAGAFKGAVDWLCNPEAQASAHLIISRKGETAQIVPFAKRAWHAGNKTYNDKAIGIEIEAYASARDMTPEQEAKVIAWVKHLMYEFGIPRENVVIHRWVSSTDCPGFIWHDDAEFKEWRDENL